MDVTHPLCHTGYQTVNDEVEGEVVKDYDE